MDLVYFASLVITSLSIYLGSIISFYTKEEIKSGGRHLSLFLKLVTAAIFGLVVYAVTQSIPSGIMLAVASLAASFVPTSESIYINMAFLLFGLVFYIASKTPLFLAVASLVFLAGIVAGSLAGRSIKAWLTPALSFFCIAALLGFL